MYSRVQARRLYCRTLQDKCATGRAYRRMSAWPTRRFRAQLLTSTTRPRLGGLGGADEKAIDSSSMRPEFASGSSTGMFNSEHER